MPRNKWKQWLACTISEGVEVLREIWDTDKKQKNRNCCTEIWWADFNHNKSWKQAEFNNHKILLTEIKNEVATVAQKFKTQKIIDTINLETSWINSTVRKFYLPWANSSLILLNGTALFNWKLITKIVDKVISIFKLAIFPFWNKRAFRHKGCLMLSTRRHVQIEHKKAFLP